MKKLLSIILSLTLMLSMSVFASAYDSESVSYNINGELVTVQVLGENALLVTEGREESLITSTEKEGIVTTTLKNLSNGEEAVFVRDNNAGTLYSSITGYTGAVQAAKSEPGTYRISYATLSSYVEIGCGAAEVVAAICTIAGLGAVAAVLAIVGGILVVIHGGLSLASKNSGVTYTVDYVTIHKTQSGHDFYVDVLKVVDVGTY